MSRLDDGVCLRCGEVPVMNPKAFPNGPEWPVCEMCKEKMLKKQAEVRSVKGDKRQQVLKKAYGKVKNVRLG